jgi:entry exclusion lipoprotein TrbK
MNLMKIMPAILLLSLLAGCQEKMKPQPKNIQCMDEFSYTKQIQDNSLNLELKQLSDADFEAILHFVGFAGPVELRRLSVKRTLTGDDRTIFEGEKFHFLLEGSSGVLSVELDEPLTIASAQSPTQTLKEKMLCQF